MISLRYFEFPKTPETEVYFNSWICTICREGDSERSGGTVAHESYAEGDGRKHALHRDCALRWHEQSQICPSCHVTVDPTDLLTVAEKHALIGRKILSSSKERLSDWLHHPRNQLILGIGSMIAGTVAKKKPLLFIGMGLQAYAIHQILPHGAPRVLIAREVEWLASEILIDLDDHFPVERKLEQLKSIASQHWVYQSEISALNGSANQKESVRRIQKLARNVILSDRLIRFWRTSTAFGALYLATKCARDNIRSL